MLRSHPGTALRDKPCWEFPERDVLQTSTIKIHPAREEGGKASKWGEQTGRRKCDQVKSRRGSDGQRVERARAGRVQEKALVQCP